MWTPLGNLNQSNKEEREHQQPFRIPVIAIAHLPGVWDTLRFVTKRINILMLQWLLVLLIGEIGRQLIHWWWSLTLVRRFSLSIERSVGRRNVVHTMSCICQVRWCSGSRDHRTWLTRPRWFRSHGWRRTFDSDATLLSHRRGTIRRLRQSVSQLGSLNSIDARPRLTSLNWPNDLRWLSVEGVKSMSLA